MLANACTGCRMFIVGAGQYVYQTAWYCCLCRDGGGCLYTVIQWITAASILQSEALANGTGE